MRTLIGRRSALAGSFLVLLAVGMPASGYANSGQADSADEAIVAAIETGLNGIETLQAQFVQVDPEGYESTGRLAVARPGRYRAEYDNGRDLLIASGWTATHYDLSNGQTRSVPASAVTFLRLLDTSDGSLSERFEIVNIGGDGDWGSVSLRGEGFDQTIVTLVAHLQPHFSLAGWTLYDPQTGDTTMHTLHEVQMNRTVSAENFATPEGF